MATFALAAAGLASAGEVSFQGLGGLPDAPGDTISQALAISGDGAVVVGAARLPDDQEIAVRWTADDGIIVLEALSGGSSSRAMDVGGGGSVIVGRSDSEVGVQAFRWSADTGIDALGGLISEPPMTFLSQAAAVSADGSVIVGAAINPEFDNGPGGFGPEAVRWANDEITGLSELPGGIHFSWAFNASADGTTIVGLSADAAGDQPFRWNAAEGMIALPTLPGDEGQSGAFDVSADGAVIVGQSRSAQGTQAFRWTELDGTTGLGYLPGGNVRDSSAMAVSAEGTVVVGRSSSARAEAASEAFVWTETTGMQSIRQILLDQGVTSIADWHLEVATDIADDGRTIVGYGQNPVGRTEAWIAVLPPSEPAIPGDLNGDGVVNVLDLLALLSGWGDCPTPPANCPADLDRSGSVNVIDLLTLLAKWG